MKHYIDMLLYVFSLLFIIFSLSFLWKKYFGSKPVCRVQDVQQMAHIVNTFIQRYGKRPQKKAKESKGMEEWGKKAFEL